MPSASDIHSLITAGLDCLQIEVHGPDEVHFQALIVSASFVGKSLVQRHQMVYRTLDGMMHSEIHALSMQALTPDEWNKLNSG